RIFQGRNRADDRPIGDITNRITIIRFRQERMRAHRLLEYIVPGILLGAKGRRYFLALSAAYSYTYPEVVGSPYFDITSDVVTIKIDILHISVLIIITTIKIV